MAVSSYLYGKVLLSLFNAEIDYDSHAIYGALVSSAYTPNQDTHQYWSDVVANEVSGTGYTANGLLLTGKTITYDGTTNTVTLDCDDLAWTNTTLTNVRYIVFYDRNAGTDATRPLIAYVDLGTTTTTAAQNLTYVIPTTGIASGSVS